MGIRFESNYQRFTGLAPYLPVDTDPLTRWMRIHEWQVDPGFTGKLLMIMLNVEPQFPTPVTINYGWMRVLALLDPTSAKWETKFELSMIGAALTSQQYTPRLTILPVGSGITFSAEQGLMTQALGGTTGVNRWWSCYVIDAQVAI